MFPSNINFFLGLDFYWFQLIRIYRFLNEFIYKNKNFLESRNVRLDSSYGSISYTWKKVHLQNSSNVFRIAGIVYKLNGRRRAACIFHSFSFSLGALKFPKGLLLAFFNISGKPLRFHSHNWNTQTQIREQKKNWTTVFTMTAL